MNHSGAQAAAPAFAGMTAAIFNLAAVQAVLIGASVGDDIDKGVTPEKAVGVP